MNSDIIIALISGISVAIPSLVATFFSNYQSKKLTIYRLEELEKKVDKHNSIIEKIYCVEDDVKDLKEELRKLEGSISHG